jgi:hypothetical protein
MILITYLRKNPRRRRPRIALFLQLKRHSSAPVGLVYLGGPHLNSPPIAI